MSPGPTTSTGLAALAERVRETLRPLVPPRSGMDPPADMDQSRRIQRALFDAGLAGITVPAEYGGAGLTEDHERVVTDTIGEFAVSDIPLAVPLGLCAPTLLEWGTERQRAEHLPGMLSGDHVWCQLFSEPGAGSDLAAVRTRAEATDDGWCLNGQKVWSSYAVESTYGLCVARTDPTVPKHAGLSVFIVDMGDPGIEVRPIRQITGDAEFNEVFLSDVRVPAEAIVGAPGDGWRVALTMLSHERVQMGSRSREFVSGYSDRAIAAARHAGLTSDPLVRQELATIYSLERILKLAAARVEHALETGEDAAAQGSVLKVGMATLAVRAASSVMEILGPGSLVYEEEHGPAWRMLDSVKLSIAGGTTEIQRNIVGERVLGLPREPTVDRDVPFNQVAGGA